MPAERLSMRKIKEVLRLKFGLGFANRQIARSCSINHSTVADYLYRAKAAGLDQWPLPDGLDEAGLEKRLFPTVAPRSEQPRAAPNWPAIHEDLQAHKHVTLQLVWQEYKQSNPDGYQYSRFCWLYQQWASKLDLVLRQEHRAGEKLFVDYAGDTIPIVDSKTGTIQKASIFVAVLGASNYTYAEATWNQELGSWIGAHVRALEFLWLFPISRAVEHHLKPALVLTAITAGTIAAVDVPSGKYFQRTRSFDGFNRAFSGKNTSVVMFAAPSVFYGISLLRKDSYAQHTFLLAGEAVMSSEVLTTVMKDVDRRMKPFEVPLKGDFSDTWFRSHSGSVMRGIGSFPSGHTISAFSLATVFADRYPNPRWHAWVAYGLATAVGFSRVSLQSIRIPLWRHCRGEPT